jgi:hypothetical protein
MGGSFKIENLLRMPSVFFDFYLRSITLPLMVAFSHEIQGEVSPA